MAEEHNSLQELRLCHMGGVCPNETWLFFIIDKDFSSEIWVEKDLNQTRPNDATLPRVSSRAPQNCPTICQNGS